MLTVARVLAGATLLFVPAVAQAKDVAGGSDITASEEELPQVITVTGKREEYGVRATVTGTRTNTLVRDIPQAISVVSEAQIQDQQLRSVADLLFFVPGATPGTGESNRDQITLRGNNTTADFFIDGVRDDVQYFRDFYNVDRVEVLKGPNAMIFGRGGGGGIVNRVTKRSGLGELRQLTLSGDSQGGVRASGDLDQSLAAGLGLRVNGVYEKGDSFRRRVELERYGITPTLGLQAGPDTRIDLSYEFFHDDRTTDRGVPSDQRGGAATFNDPAKPLKGFDKTFFGDPERSFANADVHIIQLAADHRFSDSLNLRNRTLFGAYDKAYQNTYPNGPATATNRVRLSAYRDLTERRNLFSQTDLIWQSSFAGIDQTLLIGFELGRQEGFNQRLNGVFSSRMGNPANIDAPLTAVTVDEPVTFLPNGPNNDILTRNAAVYIQDQFRPADWLELVAGLRYDRVDIDIRNRVTGTQTGRADSLWSPRLGLILKPVQKLSLYASYSRSYLPQAGDQFNSLPANVETLKPERFDNHEVGAKWEPIDGLLATVALYRLDRTNTRVVDPANPAQFLLSGEQRSKGVEVGLERSIRDNWQISAGYSWQKAKVTERTTACNPNTAPCELPLVPRHSFSLWTRYDLSKRLGLGLGAIARSKSFATIGNAVRLSGYNRVDGAVYYGLTDAISAQLNVENLFGADYYPTAHNDNNIAPGAPRTARVTLRADF